MKFIKPFRMGDTVHCADEFFRGEQIVHEVQLAGKSFIYSTTSGAWIEHEKLKLIREYDAESLETLRLTLEEEEEEEEVGEEE